MTSWKEKTLMQDDYLKKILHNVFYYICPWTFSTCLHIKQIKHEILLWENKCSLLRDANKWYAHTKNKTKRINDKFFVGFFFSHVHRPACRWLVSCRAGHSGQRKAFVDGRMQPTWHTVGQKQPTKHITKKTHKKKKQKATNSSDGYRITNEIINRF